MPKAAPENACGTCLSRKVKCDGQRPVCRKCFTARRHCDRSAKPLKFVAHGTARRQKPRSDDEPLAIQYPVSRTESNTSPLLSQTSPYQTYQSQQDLDYVARLAASSPKAALADPYIADLFARYITVLAPWYDLNDSRQTFGTVVSSNALEYPILFRAIIAFSACHKTKMENTSSEIASAFHSACVQEFLVLIDEGKPRPLGNELAATCLLRSYEIIDGDMGLRSQRHLLGAYSFAVSEPIDFATTGVLQAGAWNYLREEITVALQYRRPVRTGRIFESHVNHSLGDDMLANDISYLLARILNFCYPLPSERTSHQERVVLWQSLYSDLDGYTSALPHTFEPFSTAPIPGSPFPSLWMLKPWHIAGIQYVAVAEILLKLFNPSSASGHVTQADLDFAKDRALRICGLASTNEDVSARVNAFGPLAFCGRYLVSEHHRKALELLLIESSRMTGWPVHLIIQDLKQHWGPAE